MKRYSVVFSNIASIGYDPSRDTLEVEFLNGSIYQYFNVPKNMYKQLMAASSKGQFFNLCIRNAYPATRRQLSPFSHHNCFTSPQDR